jgi:RimJ/RimL family protein N-acetyltransferase
MINIPMPIITPRLKMRPLQPGDGQMLLDYKRESWDELLPWGIYVHPPQIDERKVEHDEIFCAQKYQKFQTREDITLIVLDKQTGRMIGIGGLHKPDWNIPMFMVGFQVRTHETGKGYGTEIAKALTKYAFDGLEAQRVYTFHAEGNIGSQRVIEKAGFKKEGVMRKCHNLWDRGIVYEHHYGLLKGEFDLDINVSWGEMESKK